MTALHLAFEGQENAAEAESTIRRSGTTANERALAKLGLGKHCWPDANYREVVKLLLARNADPDKGRTRSGATWLFIASQRGHPYIARLLLESNADPNTATWNSTTALQCALRGFDAAKQDVQRAHDRVQVVRLLVVYGADLAHVDTNGNTAQDDASLLGHSQLAGWLGAAAKCWSTERHWLFHGRFREAVHTVLLVQERFDRIDQRDNTNDDAGREACPALHLPYLPDDLWFLVCSMLLRRDYTTHTHTGITHRYINGTPTPPPQPPPWYGVPPHNTHTHTHNSGPAWG